MFAILNGHHIEFIITHMNEPKGSKITRRSAILRRPPYWFIGGKLSIKRFHWCLSSETGDPPSWRHIESSNAVIYTCSISWYAILKIYITLSWLSCIVLQNNQHTLNNCEQNTKCQCCQRHRYFLTFDILETLHFFTILKRPKNTLHLIPSMTIQPPTNNNSSPERNSAIVCPKERAVATWGRNDFVVRTVTRVSCYRICTPRAFFPRKNHP